MPARASRARFRVQHVARKPRGWRVRTKREGAHELRIAFPPGARRKGSGRLLEILHPKGERNPQCGLAGKNPAELVIFGNPRKKSEWRGYIEFPEGTKYTEAVSSRKEALRAAAKVLDEKPDWRSAAKSYGAAKLSSNPGAPGHKPGCPCAICKNMRAAGSRLPNRKNRGRRNPSVIINRGHRNPRRRNQSGEMQEAVTLYQTFQGRDPAGVIEKQVSAALRMEYTALGDLSYLDVKNTEGQRVRLDFSGDGVKLASAPNGAQLYLIGGRQSLDEKCLAKFTDDTTKDLFDLGEAVEIEYITKKAPSFETTRYYHKFGEEHRGSELPRATYDALRKQIFLFGGEYHVDAPGIIN